MNSSDAVKQINDLQKHNNQSMLREAFRIYNNLDDVGTNKFVINALVGCCKQMLKKKMDKNTMKIIDRIKNSIITDSGNVYAKASLISVYSKCYDVNNALKLFHSIPQ